MPKSDKNLFQVRISDEEKRQIKTLAASQGLTLQQALVEAFAAWAEKLQTASKPTAGKSSAPKTRRPDPSAATKGSQAWLQRAAKLDWTKCPEVEVVKGKNGRTWVVRGTNAPLAKVLQSLADGHPLEDVAGTFEVKLSRLKRLLGFAGHRTA
ncbi:MAG: hypothetical protein WBS19_22930 [Candidatus Korobacteraceae bacterium]